MLTQGKKTNISCLDDFVTTFLKFCKKQSTIDDVINCLINNYDNTIDSKRLNFLKRCLHIECDLINSNEIPIPFYRAHYFDYVNGLSFESIVERSINIRNKLLKPKTIHNIEYIYSSVKNTLDSFCPLGIKSIFLYGSYAKGEQTIFSDVDLLIVFNQKDPIAPQICKSISDALLNRFGIEADCVFSVENQHHFFQNYILSYAKKII